MAQAAKTFGGGYAGHARPSQFRCWRDPEAAVFLSVVAESLGDGEVEAVLITDQGQSCRKSPPASVPIAKLGTPEGIRLGSSRNDVLRTYGEPQLATTGDQWDRLGLDAQPEGGMPYGDTIFRYFDEREMNAPSFVVFLREDRVTTLLLNGARE
jgi:hypothetical protein